MGTNPVKEPDEIEKPRRRISGSQGPENGLGKTNLSFVMEESEDEDKESSKEVKKLRKSGGQSDTRLGGNNPQKLRNGQEETNNNFQDSSKSEIVKEESFTKRNGSVTSVIGDSNGNPVQINNSVIPNDRRRSSAEVIRQSRAYKRISKAFSQISLYPNVPKETAYQLEGITEVVREQLFCYLKCQRILSQHNS